jgi:CheY-like chemotaxis protein
MSYLPRAFGHAVLIAEDGQQGAKAACRGQPDLIICDVQLPDIDGHEVVRRFEYDPGRRTTWRG